MFEPSKLGSAVSPGGGMFGNQMAQMPGGPGGMFNQMARMGGAFGNQMAAAPGGSPGMFTGGREPMPGGPGGMSNMMGRPMGFPTGGAEPRPNMPVGGGRAPMPTGGLDRPPMAASGFAAGGMNRPMAPSPRPGAAMGGGGTMAGGPSMGGGFGHGRVAQQPGGGMFTGGRVAAPGVPPGQRRFTNYR